MIVTPVQFRNNGPGIPREEGGGEAAKRVNYRRTLWRPPKSGSKRGDNDCGLRSGFPVVPRTLRIG
jgi:hypothetical protein